MVSNIRDQHPILNGIATKNHIKLNFNETVNVKKFSMDFSRFTEYKILRTERT